MRQAQPAPITSGPIQLRAPETTAGMPLVHIINGPIQLRGVGPMETVVPGTLRVATIRGLVQPPATNR